MTADWSRRRAHAVGRVWVSPLAGRYVRPVPWCVQASPLRDYRRRIPRLDENDCYSGTRQPVVYVIDEKGTIVKVYQKVYQNVDPAIPREILRCIARGHGLRQVRSSPAEMADIYRKMDVVVYESDWPQGRRPHSISPSQPVCATSSVGVSGAGCASGQIRDEIGVRRQIHEKALNELIPNLVCFDVHYCHLHFHQDKEITLVA